MVEWYSFYMKSNPKGGFVRLIILIIILILVLSFFGINLKSVVESPQSKENFSYVWGSIKHIWVNILSSPVTYVWSKISDWGFWDNLFFKFKEAGENIGEHIKDTSPELLPSEN